MTGKSTKADLARMVAEEHASMRRSIETIRHELERLQREGGIERGSGRLPSLLGDFRDHLRRHFELEETDGLLGEEANDPGTQRIIERLLAEHRDLEQRVDRLVDEARRAEARDAGLSAAFAEELHDVLVFLFRHEQMENRLVQQLVYQDHGGGD